MNTDTISPQLLAQLQAVRTPTPQTYQKGAEQRDVPTPSREVRSQDAAVKIEISAEAQRMARGLEAPQAVRPTQAPSSVDFVSLVAEAEAASNAGAASEPVSTVRREAPFASVRAAQQADVPYQRPGSVLDISV